MSTDLRLEANTFKTPVFEKAGPAQDGEGPDPVTRLLDARFGLILPTERMFIWGVLASLGQPFVRGLEIGTWRGGTMHILRRGCDELYCLDPEPQWIPDPNIRTRAGNPVQLITGYSPKALVHIPTPLTFVFVDGDHSAVGVHRDAMALEPLMEPGGVIVFHDAQHPPVQEGLRRMHADWRRPCHYYALACDSISQTPDGVFGGLAVLVVEPTRAPSVEPAIVQSIAAQARLTPFAMRRFK